MFNLTKFKDYVEAMWLMLQQDSPDDYIIANGESHTVREFVELAFSEVGIPIKWVGEGLDEKGMDQNTGRTVIEINPRYFRPTEVDFLLGNATKANEKLGWQPKVTFRELVRLMVQQAPSFFRRGFVSPPQPGFLREENSERTS